MRLLTPAFPTKAEELPAFEVRVQNGGTAPLAFTPAAVAVFSGTERVRVYSAAELTDKIDKEAARAAAERSGEYAEKVFASPLTTHDPSAAMVMVEQRESLEGAREAKAASLQKLAELVNAIIPVSISPGGTGSGMLKLHAEDIREGQPLRTVVTLENEVDEFVFAARRAGR